MPKLSKIRLTGCRYDGLTKEHENSIFDLTKNEKADHSLFTLCNGGGKGVMMQLIFQLLLPESRWGKNNGNKVISMFYDQRRNLRPSTFHVVLEWILDTVPEKRLITGIAIKAVLKNSVGEDEGNAGLSYFLYTHEHDNKGFYSVENLPLYDQKAKEAVDIEALDDFISNNRRDFIKYSQSSVRRKDSDYFRYLETRCIYRSEWINLKDINKMEGGSGDYFIGASDNKSIFDKIIIPAISENIKNYSYDDKDNLIEMFRSNLSITKDLPVLMKREGDYKELLIEIKPIIENADIGSRLINHKDSLINEGNDLLFMLNDEVLSVGQEIEKWNKELKKSELEKSDLEYKKDNLLYNQQKRDLESKVEDASKLERRFDEKSVFIKSKNEERTLYQVNEILHDKKNTESTIEIKTMEKERLTESLELSDIRARVEDLDNEVEIEWEKTKDIWMNSENQYSAYNNYMNRIQSENKDKVRKYKDKVDAVKNDINRFIIKEEDLTKQRSRLEEVYDPMSMAFPERINEDLLKMQENNIAEINNLNEEVASYNETISKLEIGNVKLAYSFDNANEHVASLSFKIKDQEKYESELSRNISKILLENPEGSMLSHSWIEKKKDELYSLKTEKNSKLESIQRTIWEKNIDRLLNKDDYFIPNKDVVLIKDELKRIGVNVQTGAEYLNEIDEKEKIDLLNINPGFLYSLVIASHKDWETVARNIRKDLFVNNMVPVFIRSEMKSDNPLQYKLVKSRADNLVNEAEYLSWKSEMENEIECLMQTEKNIRTDIEKLNQLIQEIEILRTMDTALILKQKIDEEKKSISEIADRIRATEEEISGIKNNLNKAENKARETMAKKNETESALTLIQTYIEKNQELEIERKIISALQKEMKELIKDIESLDEDNERIAENQEVIRASYVEWKIGIGSIIKSLKEVYKDAKYDYKEQGTYSNQKTPDFTVAAEHLNSLVNERKIIEKDISEKNNGIAVLDADLKNLSKDLSRHIRELEKLDKAWTYHKYLGLPLDEITIKIKELTKEIDKSMIEQSEIKSELDMISGSISVMKEQLSIKESDIMNKHKKAPVLISTEDIKGQIDTVQRHIKSNKDYFGLCFETLGKNKDKKMKLEINLSKMKSGYPLEITKGKMNVTLKVKIEENVDFIVDQWLRKCESNQRDIKKTTDNGEQLRSRFIKQAGSKLQEDNLREKVISTVKEANISNFKNNLTSFNSMEDNFQKEILRLTNDKGKAEELMKQWTDRASMHVIKMTEGLKNMVLSMNYTNEQGYAFPLVKLKGLERLPKDKSEITHLLDEYFLQSISSILDNHKDISGIEDKELKNLMGDRVIFSKALQGKYPTLLVYKMSEKNEFRYARARDEYYTTWEAINKGEGDLPEGSGGQTLSVNTFVIMMIMSFKKKCIGNENPSTVLILDNPFGKASAKHVLDPIFEIADKLNFQLICFAAPEIIKVEISERFPVFWELKIEDGKIVHGGRVIKQ